LQVAFTETIAAGVVLRVFGSPIAALPEHCIGFARRLQGGCRGNVIGIVSAKLKEPKSLQTAIPPFEEVVKSAQDAAVLVLVY
jgi:hypothetical protein